MEIIRGKIDITAFLFNKVRKNYNLEHPVTRVLLLCLKIERKVFWDTQVYK